MKTPHKHAEFIKAWADGAEIEYYSPFYKDWLTTSNPSWGIDTTYRIKPEPKPDKVVTAWVFSEDGAGVFLQAYGSNVRFTFDGETGKLKAAEVL